MFESVTVFYFPVTCSCRASVTASGKHGYWRVLNVYSTASVMLTLFHECETFFSVPKCLTLLLTFLGLT